MGTGQRLAAICTFVAISMAGCSTPPPVGGSLLGWNTLIDGDRGLENWTRNGDANWRAVDGAIQADAKTQQGPAYLVTRTPYTDFQIHAEFWVSDDANSGIYMRCANPQAITDRSCYEANIFDRRSDPSYGTGAIVHRARVSPMPKAGSRWNSFDITVKGSHITVVLNGVKTAEVDDRELASGPIALQYAAGVVKFRKFQIRPL